MVSSTSSPCLRGKADHDKGRGVQACFFGNGQGLFDDVVFHMAVHDLAAHALAAAFNAELHDGAARILEACGHGRIKDLHMGIDGEGNAW